MVTIKLLREVAEGKVTAADINDEFMELFSNSTLSSAECCAKAAKMLAKDINAAKKEKDPDKKLKAWKVALRHAKKLRSEAKNIPADKWTDHLLRAFSDPFTITTNYLKALLIEKDLKNMSRNDTIESLDYVIKAIELKIERLEKQQTKSKED